MLLALTLSMPSCKNPTTSKASRKRYIPTYHARIADQFAANGYFVVMPDLFNGDPVQLNRPGDFNLQEWLKGHSTKEVDPIVDAAIKDMRDNHGCKRIGAVGYCFGGKYVCRFLKKGKLDAGYTAHPSFVDAEELAGIEGPLSIAAARTWVFFLLIPISLFTRISPFLSPLLFSLLHSESAEPTIAQRPTPSSPSPSARSPRRFSARRTSHGK